MATQLESETPADKQVLVSLAGAAAVPQPALFRCCPLGVQFYAPQEIAPYKLVDVRLSIPPTDELPREITCSGIVVHCEKMDNSGLFRIWVYFLDLPASARDHLHRLARRSETLCPFCENF